MKLEFNWPGGGAIYAEKWSGPIPREGDDLEFEEAAGGVPRGSYRVHKVVWFFGDDGLDQIRVVLR